MKINPLVTIIIPSYNREKLIIETLKSVKSQSISNWECIIIDDGSTDKTDEVVNSFIKDDERFKFYKRKSKLKGACTCRNEGLDLANGKYIKFLDSDDLLNDDILEKQLNDIDEDIVSFVSGSYLYNDGKTKNVFKIEFEKDKPIFLIEKLLNSSQFVPPHSWLIPSKHIKGKVKWDESLLQNQDGEYFLRVLNVVPNVVYTKNSRVYYRKHSDESISEHISNNKVESKYSSYSTYEEVILSNKDLDDKRKKMMLSNTFYTLLVWGEDKLPRDHFFNKRVKEKLLEFGEASLPFFYYKGLNLFKFLPWKHLLLIEKIIRNSRNMIKKWLFFQ